MKASCVGLQIKPFNAGNQVEDDYGDLTDYGTVYEKTILIQMQYLMI